MNGGVVPHKLLYGNNSQTQIMSLKIKSVIYCQKNSATDLNQ